MHISSNFLWLPIVASVVTPIQLNANEYQQWLQTQEAEYNKYQSAQDKEFSGFLSKAWRNYQVDQGLVRDAKPKPVIMPVAPPPIVPTPRADPGQTTQPAPPIKPVEIKKIPLAPPVVSVPPVIAPPVQSSPLGESLQLEFYGAPVTLPYDKKMEVRLGQKVSNKEISRFWDKLSSVNSTVLQQQLGQYRKSLELNDWGYAMFLYRVGQQLYGSRENEALLFSWFVLSKSGYDARVGFSGSNVHLMLPSQNEIFGLPFFRYSGKKYYVVSFNKQTHPVKNLYSYDGRYPGAEQLFSLAVTQLPEIKKQPVQRKLNFTFLGETHEIDVTYDRNIIAYFDAYPVTELDIYFTSAVSDQLVYTLLSSLKPLLKGRSEEEAVNLLLRFVQTAFDYKTDGDQFGREKYFFAEELFFYQYSDCEDRSVLFAFLVNSLLGLDVIALDYPGHVATAVRFNAPVKGASVSYKGKRYTITDPTYINANAGAVMPNFKSTLPGIIPLVF